MSRFLTYARHNSIAILALLVALGGTSYAAINLPAGSVGSRQLRSAAVTQAKLSNRSVSATKLDPRSIAGYLAFWAHIAANGRVIASSPRATVFTLAPARGIQRVNWGRRIPSRCFALASVTDLVPGNPPAYANAYVSTGPGVPAGSSSVVVQTFDASGGNVPEPVNVAVMCP
jgi:hypothetical protein